MKKKLSIKDIAKHLNVSTTTVSFILNGKAKEKRIRDEMVEKVLSFVEEVGYKPNVLAQSLRTGKSHIIVLMVENIGNHFFANIARQIEENANLNGYTIIYSSTDNDIKKTKDFIRIFKDRSVDGYIIAPPEGIEEELSMLVKSGVPVVLFDRFLPGLSNVDYVSINGADSIYNSIIHLSEKGYKNIAFITIDSLQTQMLDRLQGYEKAITELGFTNYTKEVAYNQTEESMIRQICAFLQKKPKVDAVVFSTNYLGIRGLKAIKLLDLKIPDDLAVIVFDDHDLFELHSPPITTIVQPIKEIAQHVISILLDRMNTPVEQRKSETITIPTSFKIRNSTTNHQL